MTRRLLGTALAAAVLLIGVRTASAQQQIPVSKSQDSCPKERACGTAQLPDGLVLVGGCTLVAQRGEVQAEVANLEPPHAEYVNDCPGLRAVVLHEDGALEVETSWSDRFRVSRGHLYSRVELASARRLAKQKQPKEARAALERALALDADFEEAAFELARVALGLGEPEHAAAALAPFVRKQPMRLYAQVIEERALHPLLERPPLASLRTKKAGTAVITDLKKPLLGFAAERKLFALVQRRRMNSALCGPCFETNLVVFDAAGLHAVLPLTQEEPGFDEKKQRAALRQRLVTANRFLADLGFDALTDIERANFVYKRTTGTRAASLSKARMAIAFRDGMARVIRGDQVLKEQRVHVDCKDPRHESAHLCEYDPSPHWAVWIPGSDTVILEWASSGAEGHEIITVIEVMPLDRAGGRVIMPPGAKLP